MDRAHLALAEYLSRRGDEVHLVAHSASEEFLALPGTRFHMAPKPAGSVALGSPVLDAVGRYWARRLSARGTRVVVNGGNCRWGDVNWVHYVHAAYTPTFGTSGWRPLARRLVHEGRPFAAHEVLEARWKAGPDEERDLWQGLAQICVGLTHAARGNSIGAGRLFERGAARVEEYEAGHGPAYGLDLAAVVACAHEHAAAGH